VLKPVRNKFAGLNCDEDPGLADRSLKERRERERVRPSSDENDLFRTEELIFRGENQDELSSESSFKGEFVIDDGKNNPNGSIVGGGVRNSSDIEIVEFDVKELTPSLSGLPICDRRRCVRRSRIDPPSPYPNTLF
jgi:hypothetical protein